MRRSVKRSLVAVLLLANVAYAASPADPSKVIRMAFEAPDDGLDMARTSNLYTHWAGAAIFEPLLTYDYLARPAKLVPAVAEAMPEIANGGTTYTFHIRKGIYFTPDPAFKGVRRELTAKDFAYSYKRVLDPEMRSPIANFLQGKIVGLDELAAKAKKSGHYDYDAPIAGLQTPDRYTLRIQLNAPDYNFLYVTAYSGLSAVAREAIETYGLQSAQHPVGTGPYMLQQYVPRSKIILVANPDYRGYTWNFESSGDAWDEQIIRDMRGKKMPQVGRVEISIIEEEQSRWLAFQGGQLDIDKLPQSAAPSVLDGDKLKPEFAEQGIGLYRMTEPEITYTLFNYKDPVIGGPGKEKIALRRAIAMAYSVKDELIQLRMGQAIKAEMMIPEGVAGHDPAYRSSIAYDPALANKLLDYFGYKRGADGYRSLPDGRPLVLRIQNEANATSKIISEIWKRGLDMIGVRAEFPVSNFADNYKSAMECKLMMWGGAWFADFPEGENFMQLLYGPNSGQGNNACYQSAAYDSLYRETIALPPGAERNQLYVQMNHQMEADTVWSLHTSRIRNWMVRPWVKGFKKNPFQQTDWQYLDVEKH
ncbi:MAG TPA: ABC transporter substrate-binding protein [Burkholderiaceae bacterium]|nr:ABC transporter substrate-binding protein [Burkholderiaceae bacterium]